MLGPVQNSWLHAGVDMKLYLGLLAFHCKCTSPFCPVGSLRCICLSGSRLVRAGTSAMMLQKPGMTRLEHRWQYFFYGVRFD